MEMRCGFEGDHSLPVGARGINPLTDALFCTGNSSECSGGSFVNTDLHGGVDGGGDWWEMGEEEGRKVGTVVGGGDDWWEGERRGGWEGRREGEWEGEG